MLTDRWVCPGRPECHRQTGQRAGRPPYLQSRSPPVYLSVEELERMLELKREKMSTFVENARDEIRKLWDELMVGEEEQADFAPFADGKHFKIRPAWFILMCSSVQMNIRKIF